MSCARHDEFKFDARCTCTVNITIKLTDQERQNWLASRQNRGTTEGYDPNRAYETVCYILEQAQKALS